jgi:hypothetical protein
MALFQLFCNHKFKARKVLRGENLLGDVTYGIAFYCTQCGKRRIDSGYSKDSAYEKLEWLKEQI